MKIGLVDLKDPQHVVVDKTIAGGMGTATRYGTGRFNGLLTSVKARAIRLLPYNVAYVAAILRDQGHEVSYHAEDHEPGYELAVLFTSIPSHRVDVAFLKTLAQRGIPSVVTGTLAGVAPDRYHDANLALRGEPEAFFTGGWDLEAIRAQRGALVEAGQVKDLDALPFPDWSIFPRLDSRYAIVHPLATVLPVVTSRGCPYSCSYYCPYPLGEGKAMRFRDPASVVDELRMLGERFGVRAFKFRDPIFTVNRRRAIALLDAIDASGLDVTWGCETHLNVLDEALLERMAQAGCRLIQTGIETTQEEVIKASHRKSAKLEQQEAMLAAAQRVGIKMAIYFIVGLPDDTPEGMRASLAYARQLPSAYVQITVCTPYPGTRFYQDVEQDLLTHDWDQLDQYTPVLGSDAYTSEDLIRIMSEGYRRYYLRPQWVKDYLKVALNGSRWLRGGGMTPPGSPSAARA